ncbi:MAG: bifunctional [glutamate--ammonia ligase]-adenylyl-L-tyrosine phosphorylase/[glutamate--ammonia-ligase] adenylyltransferase [Limisphaerales bacterium]
MAKPQSLKQQLQECAAPGRARLYLSQLLDTDAADAIKAASPSQIRLLLNLLSGSRFLSELLVMNPDWIKVCLDEELISHPRRLQGLRRDVSSFVPRAGQSTDYSLSLKQIRRFRQLEMLRIATRDLAGAGPVEEIIQEISDVADVTVSAVCDLLRQQYAERFGNPYHQLPDDSWEETGFCVLGMGKLGGRELNYSSDIDLIFVYTAEGHVFKERPKPGTSARGISTHQFFQRFIESLVSELTRLTEDGFLYRVDLRLRPEGDAGPLARSLESYENYYAQWGQTWERMMLIKTRCIAGDASLAGDFMEMIQPFRYPRSFPQQVLGEIAAMKRRIENEVVRSGELDRNVKLGRGGIREIEFIVQSLQLLEGGRHPFLQNSQTLPTLSKMSEYHLLQEEATVCLAEAYRFLRRVEHRLQMEDNRQTHTVPDEPTPLLQLAKSLGFKNRSDFISVLAEQTSCVRKHYEAVLQLSNEPEELPLPGDFAEDAEDWKGLLQEHSFQQVDKSLNILRTLVEGPGYVHISPRTVKLARGLVYQVLQLCPKAGDQPELQSLRTPLSDPDRVLARLDSYVGAYGSRSMLYEAWSRNPPVFELLLFLFDRSEFLAETAIHTPDLVEDLMLSGQLRRRKSGDQILNELRHGEAEEDQPNWIRRYHRAEFMRLGLRDILGLVDFELNLVELSGLADACLQYALEAVMRRHRIKNPPFAIIGLGKLGGSELTYGSDLDIVFVASTRTRNLHKLQRLAAEVMELLSLPTNHGVAFSTDARLRPDGEKGLLVNTLKAYEDYYHQRAMLWEIQAASRSRAVAGDTKTGKAFEKLAGELCDFRQPRPDIHAYKLDWREEIHHMRMRIEKERTPRGQEALAIKTGPGGLVDVEFLAQTLCLSHGIREPNTIRAIETARDQGHLEADRANELLEHYRQVLRIECVLRRWSFAGESVLPTDPAPLHRVAVRCGFQNANALLCSIDTHRIAIRNSYNKIMPAPDKSA